MVEGDAGFGEGGDFFGGAAEQERVAALETDDGAAGLRVVDHERVDFVLSDVFCAAALAYVDDHCMGGAKERMDEGTRSSWRMTSARTG